MNKKKISDQYYSEKLEIRQTKSMGKGIFTKELICKSQILISIHQSRFLTYDILAQHAIYNILFQVTNDPKIQMAFMFSSIQSTKQQYLAKRQLKGQLHIYKYIKKLPKEFNNLICWTNQELQIINNKDLVCNIIEKKKNIKQGFQSIRQKIKAIIQQKEQQQLQQQINEFNESQQKIIKKNIRGNRKKAQQQDKEQQYQKQEDIQNESQQDSFQALNKSWISDTDFQNLPYLQIYKRMLEVPLERVIHFYAAIQSRTTFYTAQHDKKSKIGALIPYLQFINYRQNAQCSTNRISSKIQVTALQDIEKDQQIFIDYMFPNMQQALTNYGFIYNMQDDKLKQKEQQQQQLYQNSFNNSNINKERRNLAKKYNKYLKREKQSNQKRQQQQQHLQTINEIKSKETKSESPSQSTQSISQQESQLSQYQQIKI